MKSADRFLKINQQLCLAHGIRLSVIKVLYKRSISENQEEAVTEFENCEEEEEHIIEDIELFDVIENTSTTDSSIQHENIGQNNKKIRKIVVVFRIISKNKILKENI